MRALIASCVLLGLLSGCHHDSGAAKHSDPPEPAIHLADGTPVVIKESNISRPEIADAIRKLKEHDTRDSFSGLKVEEVKPGLTRITFDRYTSPAGTVVESGRIELKTSPDHRQQLTGDERE